MEISKPTLSVCPKCYKEIPALVKVENSGVTMLKECPACGPFSVLIERDPVFYMLCEVFNSPGIYDGVLINVTDRCNTTCTYCMHCDNRSVDPTIEEVVAKAKPGLPNILTGGEPTVRDDLPELIATMPGYVCLLTNGLRMADPEYFETIRQTKVNDGEVLHVGISIHHKNPRNLEKQLQALDSIVAAGLKVYALLFTVDALEDLDAVMDIAERYKGHTLTVRVHAATPIGTTGEVGGKIFVSDLYAYMVEKAKREGKPLDIISQLNNKTVFLNVDYDGHHVMLISWQDKYSIDLMQVDCGPWLYADDGSLNHMTYSYIKNERGNV